MMTEQDVQKELQNKFDWFKNGDLYVDLVQDNAIVLMPTSRDIFINYDYDNKEMYKVAKYIFDNYPFINTIFVDNAVITRANVEDIK